MHWSRLMICGALSLWPSTPVQADEHPEILWCRFDLPPIQIQNGPDAGHGMTDGVIDALQKALPEFEHKNLNANIRRASEMLKTGEHLLCPGTVFSPERAHDMAFSIPYSVSRPALALIPQQRSTELQPYLNSSGELRLEYALTHSKLTLGVASGRSYGKVIDETLARLQPRSNIAVRPASNDIGKAQIQMVLLRRLDYVLIYPSEVKYTLQQLNQAQAVRLFPIEGNTTYSTLHVAAPRNEWGEAMLVKINTILRKERTNPDFHRWTLYWYDRDSQNWWRGAMKDMLQKNR